MLDHPSALPALPPIDADAPAALCTLPDGRTLASCSWGAPDGFPTFYCHGTPSSRLEGAFADAAAKAHDLRLIAIDRPGFGHSSFQTGRSFLDWPGDVLALAAHLSIDRFGLIGHSGAGPHLFACGAQIDPSRLAFIGALAPWGPVATQEDQTHLNRLDRFYLRLARRFPAVMRAGFAPLGWTARFAPTFFVKMLQRAVSAPDQEVLGRLGIAAAFATVQREAFRHGSRGGAHEAMIAYRPWGFDLGAVRVPTMICLGDDDIFVPVRMGETIQAAIPGSELDIVPGAGHLAFGLWHRLLARCRAALNNQAAQPAP